MRNQYAGTCYRCGKTVPAGKGHFERVSRCFYAKFGWSHAKWLTQHAECAIKYRDTDTHYLKNPDKQLIAG